jgi:hypothetical protein
VQLETGLTGGRAVALRLMQHGAVRGEVTGIQIAPEVMRFRVVRPGTASQVTYAAASGSAAIETTTAGFSGFLNRLHQLHGAWHDEAALNAWAAALGLLYFGLLAMGATGILLWFQNHGERWTGCILLAAGVVLALTLIVSMRAG